MRNLLNRCLLPTLALVLLGGPAVCGAADAETDAGVAGSRLKDIVTERGELGER